MIASAEMIGTGNDRRQAFTEQQPLLIMSQSSVEILFKILYLRLINRDYYNIICSC